MCPELLGSPAKLTTLQHLVLFGNVASKVEIKKLPQKLFGGTVR